MISPSLLHDEKSLADEVTEYLADDIAEDVRLTADRFIFFAILQGGDYDGGVPGCGQHTAAALAKSGIADDLIKSIRKARSEQEASAVIQQWKVRAKTKASSADLGLGKQARRKLLEALERREFPKAEALRLYTHPATSRTHPDYLSDARTWSSLHFPSLRRLVTFCNNRLDWQDRDQLLKTFYGNIWEGVVLRLIYSVSIAQMLCERSVLTLNTGPLYVERRGLVIWYYPVSAPCPILCSGHQTRERDERRGPGTARGVGA